MTLNELIKQLQNVTNKDLVIGAAQVYIAIPTDPGLNEITHIAIDDAGIVIEAE